MGQRPRAQGRAAAGFTLLEMVVVIALVALAATLTAGVLTGGMEGVRLRGATRDIASQLRYARAQAIATGQVQRFTIAPAAHRYSGPGRREGRIPESLTVTFQGARELAPAGGEGAIEFRPDGASSGGRVELATRGAVRRIDVAWLTGQVRVREGATQP